LEVRLITEQDLTPSVASDSTPAGPLALSLDSSSEQIRQRIAESPYHWQTLFVDAQIVDQGEAPQRVQVWIDRPAFSFRLLSGLLGGFAQTVRIANGMSLLEVDIPSGRSSIQPLQMIPADEPLNPESIRALESEIRPHPLSSFLGPQVGVLVFPSSLAQNQGMFRPVGMEVVAYRLALIVEWIADGQTLPSYRAWVDVTSGLFLRYQRFDNEGGTEVISEASIVRIDYDLPFPSDLFQTRLRAMPNFVEGPLALESAAVTPAAFEGHDSLGWVYAFVRNNTYPLPGVRLIRLPASCAAGRIPCPAVEVLPTPVDLVASLQPLVWSPTRTEAAWTYPLDQNQHIWTVYRFDPVALVWHELVQMEQYLDSPTWSPDGEWVVFRAQDGQGGSEIFAVHREGGDVKNLIADVGLLEDGNPYTIEGWLRGELIVRSASLAGKQAIYLVRVEEGTVRPWPAERPFHEGMVESPDGFLLAYVHFDEPSRRRIVRILDANGTPLNNLAAFAAGSVLQLTWSPDGRKLGFSHWTEMASSVYIVQRDGRSWQQAYASNSEARFVFSPDGDSLLVQAMDALGEHLYFVDLTTLESRLVQAPGVGLEESWLWPVWVR